MYKEEELNVNRDNLNKTPILIRNKKMNKKYKKLIKKYKK